MSDTTKDEQKFCRGLQKELYFDKPAINGITAHQINFLLRYRRAFYLCKKSLLNKYCLIFFLACAAASCQTIDVYEKTAAFASHSWKSAEKPSFTFEIKDTASLYNIFFVLRHEDAYNYNNIWINLTVKSPADTVTVRREFILGTNKQGWLGSGMDDIFEHRIAFDNKPAPLHKGMYTFTLQQDMREDPLDHVLNAGIRVEKVK